mgnify:CR=1 FL=1
MSRPFPFDLNIEQASTIPARLYTDPVFLELEQERVFGRTWQLVGHAGDVGESGQYFTADQPTWNSAAVVLAAHALDGEGPTSGLFRGETLPPTFHATSLVPEFGP